MIYQGLIFLALYLPFQLALNPAEGIDLASIRVFIILLFLVWLAIGMKQKRIEIPLSGTFFLITTFLFWSAFSVFGAENFGWSTRKLLFLSSIFPIYFVISSLELSDKNKKKIIELLLISGSLVAFFGFIQFISQFVFGLESVYHFWGEKVISPFLGLAFSQAVLENPSWLVNVSGKTYLRVTATFPDPHMFSFYLGMLIPLAGGMYLSERKKKYLGMLFLLILADFLTFSRGGYLALFLGAGAVIFLSWSNLRKKYKIGGAILGLGLITILVFPGPVSQRFFSSFDLREGSNQGRLEMWGKALEVIREKPLFGTGLGNYPLFVKATATYREPIYAHNTYLDIAAETGIINSLIWITLMFISWGDFMKNGRREPMYWGLAVSVLIFAVHSLVETAIFSPVVLSLFLIIISFGYVSQKTSKNI